MSNKNYKTFRRRKILGIYKATEFFDLTLSGRKSKEDIRRSSLGLHRQWRQRAGNSQDMEKQMFGK